MNEENLFRIVPCNTEESEFVVAIGNRMASEKKFTTRTAAERYIKSRPWELIVSAMFACSEAMYNEIKEKEAKNGNN